MKSVSEVVKFVFSEQPKQGMFFIKDSNLNLLFNDSKKIEIQPFEITKGLYDKNGNLVETDWNKIDDMIFERHDGFVSVFRNKYETTVFRVENSFC